MVSCAQLGELAVSVPECLLVRGKAFEANGISAFSFSPWMSQARRCLSPMGDNRTGLEGPAGFGRLCSRLPSSCVL